MVSVNWYLKFVAIEDTKSPTDADSSTDTIFFNKKFRRGQFFYFFLIFNLFLFLAVQIFGEGPRKLGGGG